MSQLIQILKKFGPLTSDEFVHQLRVHRISNSDNTARKQIQRATEKGDINSTYPVRFDKSYLYYLSEHKGKQYSAAIKKLLPNKPSFNRVYLALLDNKGYITSGQIGKISCAVPDDANYSTGKRKRLAQIIDELRKIDLIEPVIGYSEIYKIGSGFGTTQVKLAAFDKCLKLEQALICDLINWVQNVYLVGKRSFELRSNENKIVNFNTTCWDLKAPTYMGPCTTATTIYAKKEMIKAFLLFDVIGFRTYSENDASALIERLKPITLKWNTIKIFPVVLSMNYQKKALTELRRCGVMPLTYQEVWGRNVYKLLKLYKAIISGVDISNLDSIEELLEIADLDIARDGILGCIKGDLFEIMTALAYRCQGYDTTLQKKISVNSTGEEKEIDVVAIKGINECLLIECKGRDLLEDKQREEIEKHFNDRCRIASDVYGWGVTGKYKKVEAIYFTTSDDKIIPSAYAHEMIKYGIRCRVMARNDVIEFFESADSRLTKIVKQYYMAKDKKSS